MRSLVTGTRVVHHGTVMQSSRSFWFAYLGRDPG